MHYLVTKPALASYASAADIRDVDALATWDVSPHELRADGTIVHYLTHADGSPMYLQVRGLTFAEKSAMYHLVAADDANATAILTFETVVRGLNAPRLTRDQARDILDRLPSDVVEGLAEAIQLLSTIPRDLLAARTFAAAGVEPAVADRPQPAARTRRRATAAAPDDGATVPDDRSVEPHSVG